MPAASDTDNVTREALDEAMKQDLSDSQIQAAKKKSREMNQRGANITLDTHAVSVYQAIKTVKEQANTKVGGRFHCKTM